MPKTIFDFVTAQNITAYWNTMNLAETDALLGDELFPSQQKLGLNLEWIKGASGLPVVLKPSAYDVVALKRDRIGFEEVSTKMPFFKEPCISCDKTDGMASVVKLEEKRSDVNIATEMLLDATLDNDIDAFTLVSGDSDLAGPISAIRYKLKKPVAVYNPHGGTCDELKRFASLYRNIPHDMPSRCQLPDEITLSDGRTIHRPAAWA